MADYGRVSSLVIEVPATESTEKGRVSALFAEVLASESEEKGRVSALFAEVLASESTEKGRVSALFAEVLAQEPPKVRVAFMGAEVFLIPKATLGGVGLQGKAIRYRPGVQASAVKMRFQK